MTKPPIKRLDQSGYLKSSLKLPPDLHAEVVESAAMHGRSMNAEIIARLQTRQFDELKQQIAELKAMIRQVLDRV